MLGVVKCNLSTSLIDSMKFFNITEFHIIN